MRPSPSSRRYSTPTTSVKRIPEGSPSSSRATRRSKCESGRCPSEEREEPVETRNLHLDPQREDVGPGRKKLRGLTQILLRGDERHASLPFPKHRGHILRAVPMMIDEPERGSGPRSERENRLLERFGTGDAGKKNA